MRYLVFSSDDCGRCKAVSKMLGSYNTEIFSAKEQRKPLEDWRDNPLLHIDYLAQLSMQNDELPVVYDKFKGRFLPWEEIEVIAGACEGGVCKI